MLDFMYEMPSQTGRRELRITAEMIERAKAATDEQGPDRGKDLRLIEKAG